MHRASLTHSTRLNGDDQHFSWTRWSPTNGRRSAIANHLAADRANHVALRVALICHQIRGALRVLDHRLEKDPLAARPGDPGGVADRAAGHSTLEGCRMAS